MFFIQIKGSLVQTVIFYSSIVGRDVSGGVHHCSVELLPYLFSFENASLMGYALSAKKLSTSAVFFV